MDRKLLIETLESRRLLTRFTPSLLHDFSPGEASTSFSNFTPTEERLYFNVNETQFWSTDGTSEGTNYIDEVSPEKHGAIAELSNGDLLFNAGNFDAEGQYQTDIWRSNGTAAGTRPIIANGRLLNATVSAETYSVVHFTRNKTREYWRVGHDEVDDVSFLTSQSVRYQGQPGILVDGDFVYFTHNTNSQPGPLMRTRGTSSDTILLHERVTIDPVAINGGAYFGAIDTDGEHRLFHIANDSTVPMPKLTFPPRASQLRAFGDKLAFFTLQENDPFGDLPGQIWVSDGTLEGTAAVPHVAPRVPFWYSELNGVALFGPGVSYVTGLFRTDGTVEGTHQLTTAAYLGQMNDRIYIGGNASITGFTDGTEVFPTTAVRPAPPFAGTTDVSPPPVSAGFTVSNNYVIAGDPYNTGIEPDDLFLADQDGQLRWQGSWWNAEVQRVGEEFYVYGTDDVAKSPQVLTLADGSDRPIVEIQRQSEQGNQFTESLNFASTTKPNAAPLFFTFGEVGDERLWALHGGRAVEEIGDYDTLAGQPTEADFFFIRTTEANGSEVWVSDGTTERTVEIPIAPDGSNASPEFVEWNGARIVIAAAPDVGRELWVIDGSFAETPSSGPQASVENVDIQPGQTAVLEVSLSGLQAEATDFRWDLNDDGLYDDAVGPSVKLSFEEFAELDPPIPLNKFRPIRVQVANYAGDAMVETALLRLQVVGDVTPPHVVETTHESDDGKLLSISVDFNEPVTVGGTYFSSSTDRVVIGDGSWNDDQTRLTWLTADLELGPGTYHLHVNRVFDLSGNPLNNDISFPTHYDTITVAQPGDFDGDLSVGFSDFLVLSGNFGSAVEPMTNGDANGDGLVSFADFLILSRYYGQ